MQRPKHEGLVQRVRLVIKISEVPNWSKSVSLWMEFPMCLFPEGSLWQPTEIPAHSTLAVVNATGIEFSPVWSMWNMGPNLYFWTPVLDLISYYLSLERRVRGTAISSSQLCNIWLTSKHSTSRGQTNYGRRGLGMLPSPLHRRFINTLWDDSEHFLWYFWSRIRLLSTLIRDF